MSAHAVLAAYLGKSNHGEGSRGGRIIGHTKRGHAIYAARQGAVGDALRAADDRGFHHTGTWPEIQAAKAQHEAQHHRNVAAAAAHFPSWSIADHREAARALRHHVQNMPYPVLGPLRERIDGLLDEAAGHDTLARQFARHGHELDGPHGPKIGTTRHGQPIHAHHSVAADEAMPLHDGHQIGIEHVSPDELHDGDFEHSLGTEMQLANGHSLHFHTSLESPPYYHASTRESPEENEDAEFHTDIHVRDQDGKKVSGVTLSPELQELADRHADRLGQEAQENYEPPEREYDKYEHEDF